ncbi:MAG: trypsin-like serine peptidase [Phycisphaerae bacterium]
MNTHAYIGPTILAMFAAIPASAQLAAQPIVETNEAVAPANVFQQSPRPALHSTAIADAFAAGPDTVLPALGDNDFVGNLTDGLRLQNGRVYEWLAGSDLDGTWHDLPDGSLLWTYSIASPNAAALRVRFDANTHARGTQLVCFAGNDPTESVGPYRRASQPTDLPIWSSRVHGNELRIEWLVPAELAATGKYGSVQITGVLQIFPDPPVIDRGGACRIDVTCHPEWNTTARSVAQYDFVDGGSGFVCSGAMITRSPTDDFSPLFLTAAHCIETQSNANSMDIFWFFQTSSCGAASPGRNSATSTQGALILKRDEDSDTCLLGLPIDDIPPGITFAGWSSAQAPDPTNATLIHHPLGMRKSWSTGELLGIEDVSQCFTTASDTYDYELFNGGQDGGSSGAPVFDNSAHRIRAVATCSTTDNCDPTEDTGEGSLHHGFPIHSPYLIAQLDVWVQNTYFGGETGSSTQPFNTLIEGWYAVRGGGTLHLRAGAPYPAMNFIGARGMTLTAENGIVRIGG